MWWTWNIEKLGMESEPRSGTWQSLIVFLKFTQKVDPHSRSICKEKRAFNGQHTVVSILTGQSSCPASKQGHLQTDFTKTSFIRCLFWVNYLSSQYCWNEGETTPSKTAAWKKWRGKSGIPLNQIPGSWLHCQLGRQPQLEQEVNGLQEDCLQDEDEMKSKE